MIPSMPANGFAGHVGCCGIIAKSSCVRQKEPVVANVAETHHKGLWGTKELNTKDPGFARCVGCLGPPSGRRSTPSLLSLGNPFLLFADVVLLAMICVLAPYHC